MIRPGRAFAAVLRVKLGVDAGHGFGKIIQIQRGKGVGRQLEDARELVSLIRQYKLPAKVNLIPFNPWPGAIYECSDPERIKRFSSIIFEAGISAPVRTPRGRDIMAACGQLKSSSEKKSRAELDRLAEEKQAALG